jgi:hypothetical protein
MTPGLREFMIPALHRFATSRLRGFMIPDLCRFTTSRLCRFMIPDLRRFTTSRLCRFQPPWNGHQIHAKKPDLAVTFVHYSKTYLVNFDNPTFRGCKVFPEFPNTSLLGKWFDSDDPIPQKLLNSSKKCHPRNVGVKTRFPENPQRSYRDGFLELPPHPYK